MLRRRDFLSSVAWLAFSGACAHARVISGELPWLPNAGNPPAKVKPGPWHFFSGDEGRAIEAIADRIIPPDPKTPGGKDAGCAVYVDRQLAGPYGHAEGDYERPPFMPGAKNFGPQKEGGPAKVYRSGLAALDRYCKANHTNKPFAELNDAEKDDVLSRLEKGEIDGTNGQGFFDAVLKDVQMGFFADPIYGGNRDMVGWKMIGFPGARYNYLDWIDRHNERYPLPPVSLTGRADWTQKR